MNHRWSDDRRGRTLYAVGLGPGDPGLVTLMALDALRSSEVIFLPRSGRATPGRAYSILASLDPTTLSKVHLLEIPMAPCGEEKWDRAAREILERMEGLTEAAYASLGDPFLYGSFIHIAEALERIGSDIKIEGISGVNSFSAAASQALFPICSHSEEIAILSGVPSGERLELVLGQFDTLILMKIGGDTENLASFLHSRRDELDWVCVENCGTEDQFVCRDPKALARKKWGYFTVMLIRKRRERKGRQAAMPTVYFVGAGPGDPELITLKGLRHLKEADVVLYADSLINPRLLSWAKEGAEIVGTSRMTLEEITRRILVEAGRGRKVVRLSSGDPSIYGALGEQIAALEKEGIKCEIIPGVSSFSAASASLHLELTCPEVSQTVILSRAGGRTPLPGGQRLREVARYPSTVVVFLSADRIEEVAEELREAGFPPTTPAALVYRASWEDELVVRATLEGLPREARKMGVKRQALIIVGDVLDEERTRSKRSILYQGD